MSPSRLLFVGLVGAAAVLLGGCSHHNVHDTRDVKVGILTCNSVADTQGSVFIHSTVDVECSINHSGIEDKYKGKAGIAFGVDLKWHKGDTYRYTVLAAKDGDAAKGFLAGNFTGARGGFAVGYGAGFHLLVGGGKRHITLQPLGMETSKGFGVAVGIAHLSLEPK